MSTDSAVLLNEFSAAIKIFRLETAIWVIASLIVRNSNFETAKSISMQNNQVNK